MKILPCVFLFLLRSAIAFPALLQARAPASDLDAGSTETCGAFPWFIGPRYTKDCSGHRPQYNPTSGNELINATCWSLSNPHYTEKHEGPFLGADVTIVCGGYTVTLYNSDDCSDKGTEVFDRESCVGAPEGQHFVRFSAVQSGPLDSEQMACTLSKEELMCEGAPQKIRERSQNVPYQRTSENIEQSYPMESDGPENAQSTFRSGGISDPSTGFSNDGSPLQLGRHATGDKEYDGEMNDPQPSDDDHKIDAVIVIVKAHDEHQENPEEHGETESTTPPQETTPQDEIEDPAITELDAAIPEGTDKVFGRQAPVGSYEQSGLRIPSSISDSSIFDPIPSSDHDAYYYNDNNDDDDDHDDYDDLLENDEYREIMDMLGTMSASFTTITLTITQDRLLTPITTMVFTDATTSADNGMTADAPAPTNAYEAMMEPYPTEVYSTRERIDL